MTRRIIQATAQNRALSYISIFVTLVGLYCFIYISSAFSIFASSPSAEERQLAFIGFAVLLFITLRSVLSDINNLVDARIKVEAGTSIDNSPYSFFNFFDKRSRDILIIGQNLRTLLNSEPRALEHLGTLLRYHNDTNITIILTFPNAIGKIDDAAKSDLVKTVRELVQFYYMGLENDLRKRLHIHFHPGATSLSAWMRDPRTAKGMIIFFPKWATDREPGNRIFCVVREWESSTIYRKLYGHIVEMTGSRSRMLDQVAVELEVNIPTPGKI